MPIWSKKNVTPIVFRSTPKKNEVETKIWSTFFSPRPRASAPASPCVRPLCAQVPPYSPVVQSEPQPPQPSSNASSPAIRPSSPRDTAARPSALSPLPAPPPICFPPLLSRDAAACPPSFLSPLPVPLLVCFFFGEIPAPRRQSHRSRRPATVGSLLLVHVISLPLSLPHPDPPDTGSVLTRSCSLPFSPHVRAGGRCVCKQIPVVRARSSFLPGY
jgi:hypothetical protein